MTLLYQTSVFASPATYSNLENHPRFLRLKQKPSTKKVELDKKTGLPSIVEDATSTPELQSHKGDSTDDEGRRELPKSFLDS